MYEYVLVSYATMLIILSVSFEVKDKKHITRAEAVKVALAPLSFITLIVMLITASLIPDKKRKKEP